MSDYDTLPRNLPDTITELTDTVNPELPEGFYASPLTNDDSALAGDIYYLFPDDILENKSHSPDNSAKNNHHPNENKKEGVREFIQDALNKKLPELIEYHEKGYNLVRLDNNALRQLRDTLQKDARRIPESLLKPARRFTDTLDAVTDSDGTPAPELLQALPVVNALIRQLNAALDDLSATRRVSTLNWEEEVEQTAREQRGQLVTRAAERLFPQQGQAAEREGSRQKLEALLFAQSHALSAEYKKFSLLKASLAAESRITRQRLAARLQTRAQTLLEGAREARRAALDMLLTEPGAGQMNTEQLMHWSQGYQLYARYLRAVDTPPDGGALRGNPLIAAVNRAARQGTSPRARLAGSMVPLADALGSVAVHLLQEKERTEPAPAAPQPVQEAGLTGRIKNVVWDRGRKKGRAVRAASVWLAHSAGGAVSRTAFRTTHTLQRTPLLSEGTRQAINNTALLLLDEIQQAERRIRHLPGYAWVRQEAVQQQQNVSRKITDPRESALMDELVSRRLAAESDHWQQMAESAAGQIETLLSPLTRLADTARFNEFYFALSDTLRAHPAPGSAEAIAQMDETVIQALEQLAGIGRQLDASAVRLSGHGHEGGKALQEKAGEWLMALKTLKSQVKTQAIHLTGRAPDNFSRSGMLARGIAEWAQALREASLAGLTGEARTRASSLFDTVLTELLSEHRQHFADKSDPQAESLLKRVAMALKHAAEGTTVYPPTAEEILAGTRTVSADVQHWAEKKILSGALSAAISGGFKLLTGPVSLPVRIALRSAKTGWTLNRNLRAMSRVRLGEGPPGRSARDRLIHQELSKLAFRLTLSLSPAGGYGVAATVVGGRMIKGKKTYASALTKKVVVDLPQEALWSGLAYGGYAGVNAVVRASAERAMQEAWEQVAREQRERMQQLMQQLSMADSEEEESISTSDEFTGDTGSELSVETVDEATTEESEVGEEKAAATTAAEGETSAATTNKKKVPILSRSGRVKRFAPGRGASRTGIAVNASPDKGDSKILSSQISDSLKDIVEKLASGQGFVNSSFKEGQEGSVYSSGSNFYIYINEKYWPIHFKDNQKGVITLNPYAKEGELKIDVHLKNNTWIATASENTKHNYPDLPTKTEKTASPAGLSNSTVLPELYKKVKSWPTTSAFYYDNMVDGNEAQIYTDNKNHKSYIYLNGFYWPIIITGDSTASILLNNSDPQQKRIINIRRINQQWGSEPLFNTSPMPVKTVGKFSIEDYISAFFKIDNAAKVKADQLQKLSNKLFLDKSTGQHYILVNGYYWHVVSILLRDSEKIETWKIIESGGREHLNIYYNEALSTWSPLKTTDDKHPTENNSTPNSLSADLIGEMKKWDPDSSVRPFNSGPGLEGTVYQGKTGEHYIYLQNRYWHFSWVKPNVGGVTITINGVSKFIVLFREDNEWHYFDEEIVADSFDIDTLLKSIEDATLDSETREKVESILWRDNFTSLDDFLHNLHKALEDGFYRLYEKPASDALISIISLSNKISEQQKSIAYYDPTKGSEQEDLSWNQNLLNLYREEFLSEEEESAYLYAAQQAKVAVNEANIRVAQLSTAAIDKQIKEQYDAISARMKDISFWLDFLLERPLSVDIPIAQENINSLKLTITTHQTRINQLSTLRKNILDRKAEYQKVIDDYNKNYRLMNISIDFVKKALANKKKIAESDDNVSIAEELLIDFTLQKIAIRNSATGAYTQAELDKLKTLSISQTMIAQLIERHTLSQELIEAIQQSKIKFPPLKKNYQDIEWSNNEAEKIYKENYPDDENLEANQLLAPLLYWLLKNNSNYSLLRSTDIDDVVNLYYSDAYSLNPLKKINKMPEGYTPLSHMLSSEYFNSDSEYYQQFATYKEKYSDYEASENTKDFLLSSDLSLNEITAKVKKRFYFNVLQSTDVHDKHDGGMLFVELEDGRWIFFSLFPDALFSRVFSHDEMMANIWLKTIATLTPEQTHYHGIESVFLESFFLKNFDPKNKNVLAGKYHKIETRKKKEFEDFIENTLYKSSDDITYSNPFKDRAYYGLTYDFSINAEQPQETLLETLNKAFHDVLLRSATNRKAALYQSTVLQKIADIVIPFYAEIRGAIDDPESKVDTTSIMLDVVGICFVASQAGTKAASLLKNAKGMGKIISEGRKIGLAGRGLQKYVIKQMAKQGLINASGLAKISANALIDLVSPVSLGDLKKISLPKSRLTSGLGNIFSTDFQIVSKGRSIPDKYITTNISLDDLSKTHVHGVDVYTSTADDTVDRKYFIKSEGNLYQVRWDDYAHTWRTVDPNNSGRLSYGEPVIFEDGNWVINKNYGGLRGGAIKYPTVTMGEQPMREGLEKGKVTENLISTPHVDAVAYLEEIKNTGGLSDAILSPSEKCELVLPAMANFLKKKGFDDIRLRGMAFFVNGMDMGAMNHYLVIGTKEGRDYAFDITAGQFYEQYEELSGPIIMPEEKWAQKYANITSERKLIKYADYPLDQLNKVKIDYGSFSPYLVRGPNSQLPNAFVLKRPGWYFPKKSVDNVADIANTNKKMAFGNSERANPVRAAARRSRLTNQTPDTSWEYAVTLLENAELMSRGPATTLRTGIRQATKYQRTSASSAGNVDDLFASSKAINSYENLLNVKQGEIVMFMEVDPNFPAKGPRPIHVMVSLGNGRFAGVKNNVLDSSLSDGKQILTAEQLGEFVNGTFRRRGNAQLPDLQIIAGEPKNFLRPESPSLKSLAENLPGLPDDVDLAAKSTELLKQAGELATEQAAALQESLGALLNAAKGGSTITATAESLFTTAVQVTDRAALQTMEKGKLVVFANTSSPSFAIHHLMYSLGNGDFMMVNPHLLDKRLVSQNGIINASQFPDELFTKYGVLSGDISLSRLRTASLLGRDASFFVDGPILTVRLHGAPGIANYMDAYELSEVIKGLGLRESPPIKLGQIREIKLESCFGAFGFLPTGKALAHILGKKVTAYPLAFSNALRDSRNLFRRAKVYMPSDLSTIQVEKMVKQQSLNHNFWTKLLQLRQKTVARRVRRSTVLFDNTLEDIAKLASGDTTLEQFLEDYPEYKTGLSVTESDFKAYLSASTPDDESFAMRCWDILMLSTYTVNLVDKYLEG
ncbi:hypothetical protein PU683_17980 [Kosakonia cowanii]|uniref:hypothetical protein n=1 Tax=Kosakonia cowanii TaxID=208223 RepID=UPI0023F7CE4B|nr:hypothetical protein [Kosakonia cowanii]MDF7761414.1 hypothetical protein [Kosakonia cowanii]